MKNRIGLILRITYHMSGIGLSIYVLTNEVSPWWVFLAGILIGTGYCEVWREVITRIRYLNTQKEYDETN